MSFDLPTLQALQDMGPNRAAALWLERLQHDETDGDNAVFTAWLAASAANRSAWDDALEIWDSFEFADDDADMEAMRREALAFRRRRVSARWFAYAAAAAIAIVASATVLVERIEFGTGTPGEQVAAIEKPDLGRLGVTDYETGIGKQATIALADGSKLTLDTDSAVDIALRADKRMVRLIRGQAFFDVAHDATRPFRVAAGERIVTVLGTRFNVRLSPAETRVILVQGSIGVSAGHDPANPGPEIERLSPGEQLVARTGEEDKVSKVDVEPGVSWRQGFVQFDGQTLAAVAEELNRYSDRKIVVRDPRVASLRISGAFPTNDTERFIQTLTALYPVRVAHLPGGKIEILRRR